LVVFHFVCLTWIFFRADSYDTVLVYLASMGALTPGVSQASVFTVGLIGLGLAMQFVPADLPHRIAVRLVTVPDWTLAAASGAAVVLIAAMGPDGVAPFIYFQF
jgi:alginate O-acetyltransferase complex protein AlgI